MIIMSDRCLDIKEIEKLASKPGVKKIAVENFLLTMGNNDNEWTAIQNLELDSRLYKWNSQTKQAIKIGIKKYFSCKK